MHDFGKSRGECKLLPESATEWRAISGRDAVHLEPRVQVDDGRARPASDWFEVPQQLRVELPSALEICGILLRGSEARALELFVSVRGDYHMGDSQRAQLVDVAEIGDVFIAEDAVRQRLSAGALAVLTLFGEDDFLVFR